MIVVTNIGIFMATFISNNMFRLPVTSSLVLKIRTSLFLPLVIPFEYWIERVSFELLMSCLYSPLIYSAGEFQAVQLIVIAVFGAVY